MLLLESSTPKRSAPDQVLPEAWPQMSVSVIESRRALCVEWAVTDFRIVAVLTA
jgi:hypothetical protein